MKASGAYNASLPQLKNCFVPIALIGLLISGCSSVSTPLGSADVAVPLDLTASIDGIDDTSYADIDEMDRKILSSEILKAVNLSAENGTYPWVNPQSGNSGTISELSTASLTKSGCVSFKTTANTIDGIRLYHGTACQDASNAFAIVSLALPKA